MKKLILASALLSSLAAFSGLANDHVQNREGVFYDATSSSKFTGFYTDKYIYTTLSGSGEIEWLSTYRYKIHVSNGLRDGSAVLYKESVATYITDSTSWDKSPTGTEYQRVDSFKAVEATFKGGEIISMRDYNRDGSIKATTSFQNGLAKRHSQKTGKLIGEFNYLSGVSVPDTGGDKALRLFLGNSFALHGTRTIYKSRERVRIETYNNGIKDGPFFSTHSKDQTFQQGAYANGKMDGDYKMYCDDGRLAKHVTYIAGEIVETFTYNDQKFCFK